MEPRNRRTVLKLVGLGIGGATSGYAAGQKGGDPAYAVVQGDRCVPVTPVSGSEPVEDFYDWAPNSEKRWSSNGTIDLQREDTSIAFLYEGPEATSLVFVHGKLGFDSNGGAVSFSVYGLPSGGEWVVEDDNYDGPNNYDNWRHERTASEIDWTWAGNRTDGGVFQGVTADDTIRVVPRFNEAATLYGTYYQGDVVRWEFLSGDIDGPRRIELAMDEPIIVGRNDCAGDGGSSDGSGQGKHGGDGEQDTKDQRDREEDEKKQADDGTKQDEAEKKERKHERKQKKHERKQEKHEKQQKKHEKKKKKHEEKQQRKHERKQEKHERKQKKHEKKQRKHEKQQQKHEEKRKRKHEKKQEKHENKQRKHERKQEKHEKKKKNKHEKKQRKHEKRQKKHEKKKKHEEKEDDD